MINGQFEDYMNVESVEGDSGIGYIWLSQELDVENQRMMEEVRGE